MMRVKAEPRRYTGFAEASGFDSERMRPLLDGRPIQAGTRTEYEQWRERIDGLEDWEDEGGAMP
jgi:hypothetical protein